VINKPSTCREICETSWESDERAAKSKFVAQGRLPLYYSQQQVEHARCETRNISQESFCIEYIVAGFTKNSDIRDRGFVSRISSPLNHSAKNSFCFVRVGTQQ